MPRDQVVQGQLSGAGPGRSDLVARRVARLEENATTLTCFAENFFVVFFRRLSTSQKKQTKEASRMGKSRARTHTNNRPQTIDTTFSRRWRKISSTAPRCPHLLRAFFFFFQKRCKQVSDTSLQNRHTVSKPERSWKCALGARNFSELGGGPNHPDARAAYSSNSVPVAVSLHLRLS